MSVYDSLHSLLDHQSLLFYCHEYLTTNHYSHTESSDDWIATIYNF
jgi:hypothetical protein